MEMRFLWFPHEGILTVSTTTMLPLYLLERFIAKLLVSGFLLLQV